MSQEACGQSCDEMSFFPEMPRRFFVENIVAGKVFVTIHAWQMFCKRWHSGEKDQEKIAESFWQYFKRSRKIARRINYNVARPVPREHKRIELYVDELSNCQFVVLVEQNNQGDDVKVMKTALYPGY